MKRSEMIKNIIDALLFDVPSVSLNQAELVTRDAMLALQACEDAGMLPPSPTFKWELEDADVIEESDK